MTQITLKYRQNAASYQISMLGIEILVYLRSCDLALRTPRYNGHPDNTDSR